MSVIDDFRRLAGLKDSRTFAGAAELVESTEVTAADEILIKKFAKKTKLGTYDLREVAHALAVIEPGWKVDVVYAAMPVREGPLKPELDRQAEVKFAEQYGLSDCDFGHYTVTSVGFSFAWGADLQRLSWPENAKRSERPSDAEVAKVQKAFLDKLLDGVVQKKDPETAEEGQLYFAPIGKPKVEEKKNPYGDAIWYLSTRWKLASVRRGAEAMRLTAPDGDTLDMADAGPALWTWLYKRDVAARAAKWVEESGLAAKDAAKKAMKGYSQNEVVGTCGICSNVQKLKGDGALVLHGYQRPGYGWIQGSCFGVGYKAWELSPEAVEAYIKHLKSVIPQQQARVKALQGRESFTVWVDDKFAVQGSGPGKRKYTLSAKGWDLEDEQKYSSDEVKKSGYPMVYDAYKLDAASAKYNFDRIKKNAVENAERDLKQMKKTLDDCVASVALWKPRPLPGAQLP